MSGGIRRVGVVGGGLMGAGIAEVCALAGLDTVVCEVDAVAARAARDRVAVSLDRAVRRGRLEESATPRAGPWPPTHVLSPRCSAGHSITRCV
ncbi:3-hydroxyacyl-CoA dehydrogenase [Streptomyces sp. AK010]|nr:3-hydroxyacyl-CoA dehydrogenase [Streptomyces sp. AK010]